MIDPRFVPRPESESAAPPAPGPAPRRSPITPEQLQDWITRRQRFRRRVTAVVLIVLVAGFGVLGVIWSIFHQHLIASGSLEGSGFSVDWDINPANFTTGGTTAAHYVGHRNFYQDQITGRDLEPLRDLRHLQRLTLAGAVWLTDDDLAVLADLGELEELDLDRTSSGIAGVARRALRLTDRALDLIGGLKRLKFLSVASNRITDAGLAKLASLKALESLDLDGTAITDAGLDRLVGLKALKMLRVENTRVTAAGLARFQQKRPDVEVIHESAPLDLENSLR